MPDDNLSISVVVDTSAIPEAAEQVSASVDEMAVRIKAAFGSIEKAPEGVRNAFLVMQNSATQSSAAVSASIRAINEAFQQGTSEAGAFGEETEAAMGQATRGAANARIAFTGLTRDLGLTGNRALSSFIAQSQTLGPILSAAFSTIAVLAFVEIASQIPAKIIEITDALGGWTEAEKKLYTESLRTNTQQLEFILRIKTEQLSLNEAGLSGLAKTKAEQEAVNAEVKLYGQYLTDAHKRRQDLQATIDSYDPAKAGAHAADAAVGAAILDKMGLTPQKLADAQREMGVVDGQIQQWTQHIQELNAIKIPKLADEAEEQRIAAQEKAQKEANREAIEDEKLKVEVAKQSSNLIGSFSAHALEEALRIGKADAEGWKLQQEQKARSAQEAARKTQTAWKEEAAEELRSALSTVHARAEAQLAAVSGRGVNPGAEVAAKKAILDQEFNDQREAILKAINELNPMELEAAKKLSAEILKDWDTLQQKKAELDKKYRDSLQHNFQSIIGGPLDSLVNGVIGGGERINVAFAKLGQQLVVNFVRAFAQMGLQVVEFWALNELETALGLHTIGAMQAQANIKTILNNAYQAASNAYAEVPFPFNLVVAPAVFATVAALGGGVSSAAGGMVVPNDMLAMVHQNEVVLPASISKKFIDSAPGAGGGRGGGDLHIHVHATDAGSFRNSDTMKQIKKELSRHARSIGLTRK